MECHFELPEASKEERFFGTSAKNVLSQKARQLSGCNGSRMDKDDLVYAKEQDDIMRNVSSSSSQPSRTRVKQWLETQFSEERELVKYMSKLPGYLERAETARDKLLNVGVLNWGRLEKWQHIHTQMPEKSRLSSVSKMHVSSSLPKDEPSARPSRDQGHSSTHRRTKRRSLKLNSRMVSTAVEDGSQIAESYDECVKKCQESKINRKYNFKDHGSFSILDEQSYKNTSAAGSERCEKKDMGLKICPKSGTFSTGLKPEVGSNMEIKSKVCSNEHGKSEEKLKGRNQNDHHEEFGGKQQGEPEQSCSTAKLSQQQAKARRRHSTERIKEVYCINEDSAVKQSFGSIDAGRNKASQEISQTVPLTTKAGISSSRCKSTEGAKHREDALAQEQDLTPRKLISEKGRSISPFQRLSFSMGKTSKTNREKDSMVSSEMSSIQVTATSSDVNTLDCNKSSGKDRARTSPLRRLLEPLMKPKLIHSGDFQDRTGHQRGQRGSDGKLYPSIMQSGKVKFGITGCKMVNVNDSAHEKKLGSSMVQALFQVTVKNNQPLFTFAVTKESDILAATLKKLGSSEDDECTSVYTFLSIQENKKNSVRLNQRGKGKTHDIVSNVVAQMRVSSSLPCGSTREFVLFSVDLGQVNEEKSDFQEKNELAAIVIKMPRRLNTGAYRNVVQLNSDHNDSGESGFVAHPEQDISATVILQSGVHSLPHKGGPSSLIQRWRSGGSCDCGGWDVGCNLRVLANQHRPSKSSASSNSPSSADRFELFLLGEHHENQPFLSFIPLKDGIYSVSYNSSLTLPQAFSICIAAAESRKLSGTLERKISYDDETSDETALVQNREKKSQSITEEVPGRYVSYPPVSPVGRV